MDKIGSVYDTTNWAAGPKGLFLHNACRLQLSSGDKLEKAKKRWKKPEEERKKEEENTEHVDVQGNYSDNQDLENVEPISKRSRR